VTDSRRLSTWVGDRGFGASALENAITSASSELQRLVMRKQTCIDERVSLFLARSRKRRLLLSGS